MKNQGESKNRNQINSGVSFNFILYMTNLLGWGGQNDKKWVTFAQFLLLP